MGIVSELRKGRSYGSPREAIIEAVIALADADSEDDREFHAAWCRLWITLKRCGWTPPETRRPPEATVGGADHGRENS